MLRWGAVLWRAPWQLGRISDVQNVHSLGQRNSTFRSLILKNAEDVSYITVYLAKITKPELPDHSPVRRRLATENFAAPERTLLWHREMLPKARCRVPRRGTITSAFLESCMCICTDARTLLQTELQVLTDIPEVKTQLWMVANIRGGGAA
jgi:hypothetical protein